MIHHSIIPSFLLTLIKPQWDFIPIFLNIIIFPLAVYLIIQGPNVWSIRPLRDSQADSGGVPALLCSAADPGRVAGDLQQEGDVRLSEGDQHSPRWGVRRGQVCPSREAGADWDTELTSPLDTGRLMSSDTLRYILYVYILYYLIVLWYLWYITSWSYIFRIYFDLNR